MIKLKDILNEAVRHVDRSGKPFNIKGMSIIYVEQNQRFYGTSLYDKPVTANVANSNSASLLCCELH